LAQKFLRKSLFSQFGGRREAATPNYIVSARKEILTSKSKLVAK
jgi:hypothetical protein